MSMSLVSHIVSIEALSIWSEGTASMIGKCDSHINWPTSHRLCSILHMDIIHQTGWPLTPPIPPSSQRVSTECCPPSVSAKCLWALGRHSAGTQQALGKHTADALSGFFQPKALVGNNGGNCSYLRSIEMSTKAHDADVWTPLAWMEGKCSYLRCSTPVKRPFSQHS